MKFWGKSLEFNPTGFLSIYFKQFDETYTYNRGVSSIENILMGKPYIDHSGTMRFVNSKLNVKGEIKLKKRGWIGTDAFKGEGVIMDNSNKVVYQIRGKWNSELVAINE